MKAALDHDCSEDQFWSPRDSLARYLGQAQANHLFPVPLHRSASGLSARSILLPLSCWHEPVPLVGIMPSPYWQVTAITQNPGNTSKGFHCAPGGGLALMAFR